MLNNDNNQQAIVKNGISYIDINWCTNYLTLRVPFVPKVVIIIKKCMYVRS